MTSRGLVLTLGLVAAGAVAAPPAQAAEVRHLHRAEAVQVALWAASGMALPGTGELVDCRRVRANVRRCSFAGEGYAVRVRETGNGYYVTPVGVPALDIS